MSMNMRDEVVQMRCITTLRWMGTRPMVVGTWRMNYLMAMGIRPMAIDARHLTLW